MFVCACMYVGVGVGVSKSVCTHVYMYILSRWLKYMYMYILLASHRKWGEGDASAGLTSLAVAVLVPSLLYTYHRWNT